MAFGVVDVLILMVGVSLLPLFIDTINTFIPIGRVVHVYISRLLVLFLSIQYLASIYYFFTMVIPFYAESSEIMDYVTAKEILTTYHWKDSYRWNSWTMLYQIYVVLASFVAVWLWCNTTYSYIQAIRYTPSPIPPNSELLSETKLKEKQGRVCLTCNVIKKEDTHHCSQCGRCIPNMDHHCPFTGNCVSAGKRGNFTFFFLFIFYTAAGCAFAVVHMTLPFYYCYFQREISMRCIPVGSMSLIYIPGLLLLCATGGFTLLHILLICFGKSTLEFMHWLDGHDKAAQNEIVETEEYINQEHNKLRKMNKLHCSIKEFLFPYFIDLKIKTT